MQGFLQFLRNQRGASELVETIFALQIVLLLIFGMIFFIMAMKDDVIMESAARTGARTFGITKNTDEAINAAQHDLAIGGTRAGVSLSGNSIVVTRAVHMTLPFGGQYNFGLRKQASFHVEDDSWYYKKKPESQASPIDGYSGYTGNPYK